MENSSSLPELRDLDDALGAIDGEDVRSLLDCRSPTAPGARPLASWSIAECLDHLAHANRAYLAAMEPAASRAAAQGSFAGRPAVPGLFGRLFVRSLRGASAPHQGRAGASYSAANRTSTVGRDRVLSSSHDEVRRFLRHTHRSTWPACVANPFVRGLSFSLATGLHAIAAHERRHLWQARGGCARLRPGRSRSNERPDSGMAGGVAMTTRKSRPAAYLGRNCRASANRR